MKKYWKISAIHFLNFTTGLFFIFSTVVSGQNVAINTTGSTADASALLDISGTTGGLLIPRMTGANMTSIASPATGLIVYNTTMANFYYNQGTPGAPNWVPLSNATSGWYTSGNTLTGTIPATPNEWLGSSNAADLIIKTSGSERARIKSTGNFGINTGSTVNATLDVNGSVAFREGTALTLANGANNDVAISASAFLRITGPTAAFSISGLTGGVDGRILTLYNTTSYAMTLVNDLTSTAANRIYTLTGANFVTAPGPCIVTLQYNSNVSRWLVISRQDKSMSVTSGTGPSILYPDGTAYSTTKFVDYGTSDYTVPANTTLYILQIPLSGGVKFCVDGIVLAQANGTALVNAPGCNSFTLAAPIVVGAGSVVRASTTADPGAYTSVGVANYFSGFEVTGSTITPVTSSFPSGSVYQVPAGKTLVVTNIYDIIGAVISISPDNSTWIPFLQGPSNYASQTVAASPVARADFRLAQLLQPILVPSGYYIRSSDANAYRCSFNGYLR